MIGDTELSDALQRCERLPNPEDCIALLMRSGVRGQLAETFVTLNRLGILQGELSPDQRKRYDEAKREIIVSLK